ncbi:MAG: hypothetical protein LWY06_06185 [Firmicutes bacterium]|nr:hypothetical protein [Bacillota bacterium]
MLKGTRQEIKNELKQRTEKIHRKVFELFGDYSRDIDFSFIGLFSVLFNHELNLESDAPGAPARDRLVVSNPRTLPSLIAVLAESGYLNWKECKATIMQLPKLLTSPNIALFEYSGIDLIAQSSYQAMLYSIGAASVGKASRNPYRVFHVMTEKRSTMLQEILMSASESKLSNHISIVPKVDLQKRASIVHFWFSMGWQLEEVRFDDTAFIFEGLQRAARTREKPVVMLG